jgi:hypothetical protein
VLLVSGRQTVPVVGQSGVVLVQVPAALASQRQIGRHTRVVPIMLHSNPGAQSAAPVHASFSRFVRVASGQAQSTWSPAAGITHASKPGHPPRVAAAAARGSQLNVQVL